MEITGSADETEMTKNTKDAAHEHAAASINVMTEKKKRSTGNDQNQLYWV